MTSEIERQQAMLLITQLCLTYDLAPADLEAISHQLAQFEAICDYRTQGASDVAHY